MNNFIKNVKTRAVLQVKQLSSLMTLNTERRLEILALTLTQQRFHHSTVMQQRIPFTTDFFFRQVSSTKYFL